MRRLIRRMVLSVIGCAGFAGASSAEMLNFACSAPDNAHAYRLAIDLDSDLIASDSGQGARRWAAIITDKDVSWDEVYNSRIAHIAHHYVLDRATGALHATDLAHDGSAHGILSAACSKSS